VLTHFPEEHFEPATQAVPHAPQLASSKLGFTQVVPPSESAQESWQAVPHVPATQVAAWFAPGAAHPVHEVVPQLVLLSLGEQTPEQLWYPAGHAMPQTPPTQVAVAPPGQAVQEVPQVAGSVFDAQVVPHAWKPALQLAPHVQPLQVATPLAGVAHGRHEVVPQLLMLVFETQTPAQR
jgi:hypothetical protein